MNHLSCILARRSRSMFLRASKYFSKSTIAAWQENSLCMNVMRGALSSNQIYLNNLLRLFSLETKRTRIQDAYSVGVSAEQQVFFYIFHRSKAFIVLNYTALFSFFFTNCLVLSVTR